MSSTLPDDALHLAPQDLGQERARPHLGGDPVCAAHAARGDVQVPARRGVAERAVAQHRGGQRRRRRGRVQQAGRRRPGLARRGRVDPAVAADAALRASRRPAARPGGAAARRSATGRCGVWRRRSWPAGAARAPAPARRRGPSGRRPPGAAGRWSGRRWPDRAASRRRSAAAGARAASRLRANGSGSNASPSARSRARSPIRSWIDRMARRRSRLWPLPPSTLASAPAVLAKTVGLAERRVGELLQQAGDVAAGAAGRHDQRQADAPRDAAGTVAAKRAQLELVGQRVAGRPGLREGRPLQRQARADGGQPPELERPGLAEAVTPAAGRVGDQVEQPVGVLAGGGAPGAGARGVAAAQHQQGPDQRRLERAGRRRRAATGSRPWWSAGRRAAGSTRSTG